jgi:hypothetical protein
MAQGVYMGGRLINDHKFWAGGPGKDMVLPDGGGKTKTVESADGAGALGHYEDTNETIVSQQRMGEKKLRSHPHKTGYRN